jgi:hypothetical protein
MEQFPINPQASSNVKWARYNPVNELLEVDFKDANGNYASTYEYGARGEGRKVTRQDWEAFRAATRPGQHFAEYIRNRFPYRRVKQRKEEPEAPAQESLF